jgi:hypothetical protein
MGQICSSETSVSNRLTLRNNPENRRIQFSRGESPGQREENSWLLDLLLAAQTFWLLYWSFQQQKYTTVRYDEIKNQRKIKQKI